MEEALKQLIEFLKDASPHLWTVLLRQVYIEAAGQFAWAAGMGILCILLVKLGFHAKRRHGDDEYSAWDIGMWLSWSIAGMIGLVAFGLLISAVQWLANPEFYAIRYIIQSLRN